MEKIVTDKIIGILELLYGVGEYPLNEFWFGWTDTDFIVYNNDSVAIKFLPIKNFSIAELEWISDHLNVYDPEEGEVAITVPTVDFRVLRKEEFTVWRKSGSHKVILGTLVYPNYVKSIEMRRKELAMSMDEESYPDFCKFVRKISLDFDILNGLDNFGVFEFVIQIGEILRLKYTAELDTDLGVNIPKITLSQHKGFVGQEVAFGDKVLWDNGVLLPAEVFGVDYAVSWDGVSELVFEYDISANSLFYIRNAWDIMDMSDGFVVGDFELDVSKKLQFNPRTDRFIITDYELSQIDAFVESLFEL